MTGFVYLIVPEAVFMRHRDEHLVKIGFTRHHPKARLHALEAGSPTALELAAYFPGGVNLEKALHETFAPLRSHREWFYLQGKLFDFVCYLYNPPTRAETDREALENAVHDTIFAQSSSHPSMTDEFYLGTAHPQHLALHFPEVFA